MILHKFVFQVGIGWIDRSWPTPSSGIVPVQALSQASASCGMIQKTSRHMNEWNSMPAPWHFEACRSTPCVFMHIVYVYVNIYIYTPVHVYTRICIYAYM